ncbi:MAG: helix-turn-helix domain-containing protein [Planctomycetales bacterium]|nr:helix-turn-helix domain-containing protein [Planctomycetales bacterium]
MTKHQEAKPIPGKPEPQLADDETIARMLGVCRKTVSRMADSGRMPSPVRLGRAKRWRINEVQSWISDGCPNVRRAHRGRSK